MEWEEEMKEQAELAPIQERGDRERIARDEIELGACRYASFCKAVLARDEVLSMVAHDLRNPLGVIESSASLVRDLPLSEEKKTELLDIITESAEWMNRLIQDLLDVSRIEAGELAMERRRFRAEALLDEAVHLFRPLAEGAGVDLVLEVSHPLPEVEADPVRILQVLSNLIGNAVKFTPAGGRIRLVVTPEHEGKWVRFSVIDTGPGIALANMGRLFDRFWQAHSAHAAGAGLGLAISKAIVEQHGGTIAVESEPGAGATFHFRLPAATAAV